MTMQTEEQLFAMSMPKSAAKDVQGCYVLAWALCLVFYFLQYALRSAPGVMVPELRTAFGLSALGLSSVLGRYYYTYAGFAIVVGATLDRYGGRLPVGVGILGVAAGSILFGLGSIAAAETGRLLQGAGSAFALTGAIYMASHGFSDRWLATVVGFTQLAGMLGGFAGQFVVGPLVHGPIGWQAFWLYAGLVLVILGAATLALVPAGEHRPSGSVWSILAPYKVVLTNPQYYLCGLIGGLVVGLERWLNDNSFASVNEIRGRLDAGHTKLADFVPRAPSMLFNHAQPAFLSGSQRLTL